MDLIQINVAENPWMRWIDIQDAEYLTFHELAKNPQESHRFLEWKKKYNSILKKLLFLKLFKELFHSPWLVILAWLCFLPAYSSMVLYCTWRCCCPPPSIFLSTPSSSFHNFPSSRSLKWEAAVTFRKRAGIISLSFLKPPFPPPPWPPYTVGPVAILVKKRRPLFEWLIIRQWANGCLAASYY